MVWGMSPFAVEHGPQPNSSIYPSQIKTLKVVRKQAHKNNL